MSDRINQQIEKVVAARLVLKAGLAREIHSLPLPPGPIPSGHICAAIKTVNTATETVWAAANKQVIRIVHNIDEYGKRIY